MDSAIAIQQILRECSKDDEAYQRLLELFQTQTAPQSKPNPSPPPVDLQRQRFFEKLYQIAIELLNQRSLEKLMQDILDASVDILDAPYGEINLVEGDELVVYAVTENQRFLRGDRANRDQARVAWRAFDTHKPAILDDYSTWAYRRPMYESVELHAIADFPILTGDTCLGTLGIGRTIPHYPFTAEEIQHGILLSQLAALAIHNVKQYEDAIHEIEERKQVEEALRRSESRMRFLFENNPAVLFSFRVLPEGGYVDMFTSDNLERAMGFTPEQFSDWKFWASRIHPEDRERVITSMNTVSPTGTRRQEYRILMPDGTYHWLQGDAQLVRQEPGQLPEYVGVLIDVTDQRLLEQKRLELDLERGKRHLLEQFITDASHDLRTPITALITSTYLLNQFLGRISFRLEHLREQTQITPSDLKGIEQAVHLIQDQSQDLEQSSGRLRDLIEGMILMSSYDRLEMLERTAVDPVSIIETVVNTYHQAAADKSIDLTLELGDIPPHPLNYEGFGQALHELLKNALQYTAQGGQIKVRAAVENSYLIVEVQDNGVGIAEKDLPHIFKRFYRADESRGVQSGGTGLGLSVAARIIELHGGQIEVTSVEGQGSTFRVSIPSPPNHRNVS
ncbi:MAG: PAS domain-containing protein [Anaerolinea sp.]|nr:PAS domain-containing protein [Anaerolinea sp.]